MMLVVTYDVDTSDTAGQKRLRKSRRFASVTECAYKTLYLRYLWTPHSW